MGRFSFKKRSRDLPADLPFRVFRAFRGKLFAETLSSYIVFRILYRHLDDRFGFTQHLLAFL